MPKKYFKYYLTAITAILFIACSEKDTLNGEGMLHLKVDINRKTFCSAFPNHFVSILHLLTQNELWFFHSFSNNF